MCLKTVYQAMACGISRMSVYPVCSELPGLDGPPIHDATDGELTEYLLRAQRDPMLWEALTVDSPRLGVLLDRLAGGERLRRDQLSEAAISVARYTASAAAPGTPSGLLAGAAPVSFGGHARVRRGTAQVRHGRVDRAWLHGLLERLEAREEVLRVLDVVVNDQCIRKGASFHVPPRAGGAGRGTPDGSGWSVVQAQPLVTSAVELARRPIGFSELLDHLADDFPALPPARLERQLHGLVRCGLLLTTLFPSPDCPDPMGHVSQVVEGVSDPPVSARLRELAERLADYSDATPGEGFAKVVEAVKAVDASYDPAGTPIHMDLRLDADIALPSAVADEAAAAVNVLWRISPTDDGRRLALRAYRDRFVERYGPDALVPLVELVDPERGLGRPEWTWRAGGDDGAGGRDAVLAQLIRPAGRSGREVVLSEEVVDRLTRFSPLPAGPTTEVRFQLIASEVEAVDRGDFGVVVLGGGHQADTHFADTARALPELTGQVRADDRRVVRADEVLVGVDEAGLRLLSSDAAGEVDLVDASTLAPRTATGPAARLLREIALDRGRSWTDWDWGSFGEVTHLPRVRYGRAVLAPERWHAGSAMREAGRDWSRWKPAFDEWRELYDVPAMVLVGGPHDHQLTLNLDLPLHQSLLFEELLRQPSARIEESLATVNDATGWSDGYCAELVVQLRTAVQTAARRNGAVGRASRPQPPPLLGDWITVRIAASPPVQDEILTERLPWLIDTLGEDLDRWSFVRHDGPGLSLRLGGVRQRLLKAVLPAVGAWTTDLVRTGLAGDCALVPHGQDTTLPGAAQAAADVEDVNHADSEATVRQLLLARRRKLSLDPQLVTALGIVATARASCPDGWADWLLQRIPRDSHREVFRTRRAELRELIGYGTQALADRCGGPELATAWGARDAAVGRLASALHASGAPLAGKPEDVGHDLLMSLLRTHHQRARAIDETSEAVVFGLARGFAELTVNTARHRG